MDESLLSEPGAAAVRRDDEAGPVVLRGAQPAEGAGDDQFSQYRNADDDGTPAEDDGQRATGFEGEEGSPDNDLRSFRPPLLS